jgi:hypothetical protein
MMTTATPTTSAMREVLMANIVERVEAHLADAAIMNQLLARGIHYAEARERLIEFSFDCLSKQAGI